VGMDAAPRMLELAEERLEKAGFGDRYDLRHGLFPDDRPLGSFDHAIVMGVMDYVAEPIGFLRALASQVTASAVVSFPSVHWLRSPLRRVRYKLRRCPLFLYRERDIVSTLERAGLESQEIAKIPGAGMDFVVTLAGTAEAGGPKP